MWYKNSGNDNDVVLNSEVRLARNINGYPFEEKLTEEQADELVGKIKAVFDGKEGWTATDMSTLDDAHKGELADKRVISSDFAKKSGKTCLIENDDCGVYIMVLEEDHLRIRSVLPGFNVSGAADEVYKAEEMLDRSLDIAFSEKLGYITHCPTDLGTGMRASVMLSLPAFTVSGRMRRLSYELARMGFSISGESAQYIYQISNEATLGVSEEETLSKLEAIVKQVVEQERTLRGELFSARRDSLTEKARRDIGIIMYAGRLSLKELTAMYSEIRLCAALSYLDIPVNILDEMFVESMHDVLAVSSGAKETSEIEKARAERAREIIGRVNIFEKTE